MNDIIKVFLACSEVVFLVAVIVARFVDHDKSAAYFRAHRIQQITVSTLTLIGFCVFMLTAIFHVKL